VQRYSVALAAFVLRPRNVLLLDEPSNHLDVVGLCRLNQIDP
jgi:ATPase subunit of ABC transporter with duplicated ATPase domains